MLQFRTARRVLPAFVLAFVLTGCGLFGSSSNPLDGTLTYEVQGPSDAQVFIERLYHYSEEGCTITRTSTMSLPVEGTLKPEETSSEDPSTCTDVDLSNFDGVRVSVTLPPNPENPSSLTVKLLSDGTVADEATTPTDARTWVVEVGRVPRRNQPAF